MSQLNTDQIFLTAIGHARAGRLPQAQNMYQQILAQQPRHVGALHQLGLLNLRTGRSDIAMLLIRQAIDIQPNKAELYNDLGTALSRKGEPDQAIEAFSQAITLMPRYAEALFNLGNALQQQGQLDKAIAAFRQAAQLMPNHSPILNSLGLALAENGQLVEAIAAYRQAMAGNIQYAEIHNNLGGALKRNGQLDQAIAAFRQSIALRSDIPQVHMNLGNALKDAGQLEAAIVAYRRAISLNPNFEEFHCSLSGALRDNNQLDQALVAARQAIAINPDSPQSHCILSSILRDKGDTQEAISAAEQAISLDPNSADAHCNLGNALWDQKKLEQAVSVYRQAIALDPNPAEFYCNLSGVLQETGQPQEAIAAARQAIALKPNYAEAHSNLGNSLCTLGQLEEAISATRHAITLKPDYSQAHNNLGNALADAGRLDEAVAAFRRAIELNPKFAEAHSNLGNALKDLGQPEQAVAAYRQALALKPDYSIAHDNLLYTLHYHPGHDAQAIAEEHRRWNHEYAEPLKRFAKAHSNDRNPDRRLRIGYVSADFRNHPVGRFLLPLLAHHDKSQFEVFAYSQASVSDAITQRLHSYTDAWRSIASLSDTQAADQIRQDQIDILIDLSGHTAGNRLLLFAAKPAPIQATWLGYPNTTGLTTIDYRLTDANADPPGKTDSLHSETLLRLPHTAWCFEPHPKNLPLNNAPLTPGASITFGSFNNFSKITPSMLELWAKILLATPGSRLSIKAKSLRSGTLRERVQQLMETAGVTADRLDLNPWRASHEEHLASYEQVHIALDTFPYHGTTTTAEALWMGVPVITLAGATHVSRVGVSLLTSAGVPELIANSDDEYVRLAIDLAHDLARLNELRSTLRTKMESSPLMDASRFARNIESAYRQMWQAWIKSESQS